MGIEYNRVETLRRETIQMKAGEAMERRTRCVL